MKKVDREGRIRKAFYEDSALRIACKTLAKFNLGVCEGCVKTDTCRTFGCDNPAQEEEGFEYFKKQGKEGWDELKYIYLIISEEKKTCEEFVKRVLKKEELDKCVEAKVSGKIEDCDYFIAIIEDIFELYGIEPNYEM